MPELREDELDTLSNHADWLLAEGGHSREIGHMLRALLASHDRLRQSHELLARGLNAKSAEVARLRQRVAELEGKR